MTHLRLSVLITLLAAALAGWTLPTLYGDSGIVTIPIADVQPEATFELAATSLPMKTSAGSTTCFPFRLNYGVAHNIEIGVVYSQLHNTIAGFKLNGLAAKIALIEENQYEKMPGIAVGIRSNREESAVLGDLNQVQTYGVVSKALLTRGDNIEEGFTLRLHTGLSLTSYSGAQQAEIVAPFGGITFTNANGSAVALDYTPEEKDGGVVLKQGTVSGSLTYPLSRCFWLQLGSTRAYGVSKTSSAFVGIVYRFADTRTTERRKPERL